MDKNTFWKLKESLKQDEALMIYGNNVIKHFWKDSEGSSHKQFIGKLEDFPETIVPVKSKLWATPPVPPKQSFYKFGEPEPRYNKKDNPNLKKIELWMMKFNAAKVLELPVKKSKWTDTFMRVDYDVETSFGISVYSYNNVPRYVEFKGEKLIIEQLKPELNTQIFQNIDEVK